MKECEIKKITNKIKKFRDKRDWMQFHDPKSMAASITIEAAELLEHFQWKNRENVDDYIKSHKDHIAEEVADVAIYLFELADNLGLDLIEVMEKKLKKNAEKYPTEKARGKDTKYNKL
jgi:NTP pyrophosphatase (non-canonical NTP hydrolase)